jgi:two-component system sensor histidine kinase UhpB
MSFDATAPLRLLFVEDAALDYMLLVQWLVRAGLTFESERVEDEATMRAALARARWDAVISDHNLPAFSSIGALATLKATGLDLPFLIVSGDIGEDVAVDAMVAGADDYVLKSNLARLAPALQRGLAAAATRRREREALEALREREARLASLTENLPGVVFRMHQAGAGALPVFDYASAGARALFGVESEALASGGGHFIEHIRQADREGFAEAFTLAAGAGGQVHWEGRLAAIADGEERPRWIALAGSQREAGGGILWEGVITDISAQKAAEEALRGLSLHLEHAKEDERRAVAREIHDDIGGTLTSIRFDLAWLRGNAAGEGVTERIDGTLELLGAARAAADRIMRNLRPRMLELGIVAALDWHARDFARRHAIACSFSANREAVDLPEDTRTAAFRICQEALTNVAKHARATEVRIEMFADGESVSVEIADNGSGIDESRRERPGHYGLRGMGERAAALGGWLEINSAPGRGTSIMLSVPVDAAVTGKATSKGVQQ